jgi:hypothetical protein
MMSVMTGAVRREYLRRRIRSEVSTATRLCEALTDPGLRKRLAGASLNLAAVEVFFLNADRGSAHDEDPWLDIAEYWLAVHTGALRGLESEASPADARRGAAALFEQPSPSQSS